jgi:hypothetical protein
MTVPGLPLRRSRWRSASRRRATGSRAGAPALLARPRVRQQCRASAEQRFSLTRMAADHERLYRRILEHPAQIRASA